MDRTATDTLLRPRALRTTPDELFERCLELLSVGSALLVQDHEVDRKPLRAPVLAGTEALPHDVPVLWLVDADEDDRQIPRDSVRPER